METGVMETGVRPPYPRFTQSAQDRNGHPSQVWKDQHAHEAQARRLGGWLQGGDAGHQTGAWRVSAMDLSGPSPRLWSMAFSDARAARKEREIDGLF